jgi:ketosteroid isomerase-like protein
MKIPVIAVLFFLARLACAQTPDPELMKAALHSCQVFGNTYNNNDPQALTQLFTEDATLVTDTGVFHGQEDIGKCQTGLFKVVHFSNHKADPISAYPIGTDGKQFWAFGSWSHTIEVQGGEPFDQKGFWSAIILNDGTGRDVMQTYNIAPAPAPTK